MFKVISSSRLEFSKIFSRVSFETAFLLNRKWLLLASFCESSNNNSLTTPQIPEKARSWSKSLTIRVNNMERASSSLRKSMKNSWMWNGTRLC